MQLRSIVSAIGLVATLGTIVTTTAASAQPPRRVFYGAIAVGAAESYGTAYNYSTRRAAEIAALNRCGNRTCRVAVWFRNGCGAVAGQGDRLAWGYGPTRAAAEAQARSALGSRGQTVWACTNR